MPDRRQGDRRDTSKFEKKLSISLGNFILICIIFILVIASIFTCSFLYQKGYDLGLEKSSKTNYNSGYTAGYNVGYDAGYDVGYEDCSAEFSYEDDLFEIIEE